MLEVAHAIHTSQARPPTELAPAAAWLAARVDQLRHHPDADRLVTDLERAAGAVRRPVDSPPDRRYLGECGPWRELRSHGHAPATSTPPSGHGTASAGCAGHGTTFTQRRAWLDELVHGYSYTATDIEAAYQISASTFRTWAARGATGSGPG